MIASLLLAVAPSAPVTPAPLAAGADLDQVWVVDANGGGDFTDIQSAVQVTFQGWTILVRPGTYSGDVTLFNHSMTIVAEVPGTVVLEDKFTITGLGATRDLILSGLVLEEGFEVADCTGLVRMENCSTPFPVDGVEDFTTSYHQWPDCGIGKSKHVVRNSKAVTFVGCEFFGARGWNADEASQGGWDGAPGHHGLLVEDAKVALYDCNLIGGPGGYAISSGHFPVAAGAGGDGVRLLGDSSSARVVGGAQIGGTGGTWLPGGNGSFGVMLGCDGTSVREDAGSSWDTPTHPNLDLAVDPVLRGGVSSTMTITGPAGVPTFLVTSNEPHWRLLPGHIGALHLLNPLTITPLGQIPAGGELNYSFTDPGPPQANEFVSYQFQVFAVENGQRFLSNPKRAVVVDSSL